MKATDLSLYMTLTIAKPRNHIDSSCCDNNYNLAHMEHSSTMKLLMRLLKDSQIE